jgi:hypothetical protein
MDYAITNALSYRTNGLPQSLIIYDIVCQWIINFFKRLKQSNHMDCDEDMELLAAVGKFHLNAHIPECFARFTLNFMHGSGELDGEILETLWPGFNKLAGPARTMTKFHRREVYDDFMRDSNFKKLVRTSIISVLPEFQMLIAHFPFCSSFLEQSLLQKHKAAVKGLQEAKIAFDGVTKSVPEDKVAVWRAAEKKAMAKRGSAMKIFETRMDKGMTCKGRI